MKLRIGNHYVTDIVTETVSTDFNLKDINDYSKRKTSFTKPIRILHTANTAKVFKEAFHLNSDSYDFTKKVQGELIEDEITILRGYVYLETVTKEYYEIVLSGDNINLVLSVGEKDLSELDFSENLYLHTLTKQHILSQWQSGEMESTWYGIKYPLLDYDGYIIDHEDFEQDYTITPCVHVIELLEQIAFENGYILEISNVELLALLRQMVIPSNFPLEDHLQDYKYLKAHLLFSGQSAHFVYGVGDYNTLSNDTALKTYTGYIIETSGMHIVSVTLDFSSTPPENDNPYPSFDVFIEINGRLSRSKRFQASETLERDTFVLEVPLKKGDKLDITVFVYGYAVNIHPTSFVELTVKDYIYNSSLSLDMRKCLPTDYKQKDFLTDIIKMFNLYLYPDPVNEKKLHLMTFDDFYEGFKILDWSKKIDTDSIETKLLDNNIARDHIFKFSDGKDLLSTYATRSDTDYFATKTINYSDFAKGQNIVEISRPTPISTGYTDASFTNITDYFIGRAIVKDNKRDSIPPTFYFLVKNSNSYPNKKLFVTDKSNQSNNDTPNHYYCSTYNTANASPVPSNDFMLGFNHQRKITLSEKEGFANSTFYIPLNNTLYYFAYVREIEGMFRPHGVRNRIIEADFYLKKEDVDTKNFRNIVFVSDPKIGSGYFRIESIKGYQKGKKSRVTLIGFDPYYEPLGNISGVSRVQYITLESIKNQ